MIRTELSRSCDGRVYEKVAFQEMACSLEG